MATKAKVIGGLVWALIFVASYIWYFYHRTSVYEIEMNPERHCGKSVNVAGTISKSDRSGSTYEIADNADGSGLTIPVVFESADKPRKGQRVLLVGRVRCVDPAEARANLAHTLFIQETSRKPLSN